jgi:hypothetical protein
MASSQVAALGGKAMRHAALPLLQRGLVKSLLPHVVALPVRRVSQRGLHGRAASLGVAKQRGTAVYQVNAKYAMEAHPDKKPSKDGHKGEDAQFIRESDSWVVCGQLNDEQPTPFGSVFFNLMHFTPRYVFCKPPFSCMFLLFFSLLCLAC